MAAVILGFVYQQQCPGRKRESTLSYIPFEDWGTFPGSSEDFSRLMGSQAHWNHWFSEGNESTILGWTKLRCPLGSERALQPYTAVKVKATQRREKKTGSARVRKVGCVQSWTVELEVEPEWELVGINEKSVGNSNSLECSWPILLDREVCDKWHAEA